MKRISNLMLAMAGAMMVMGDHSITRDFNSTSTKRTPRNREELKDYIFRNGLPKDSRQLREFSIHGKKVMAYSRKDAITRLKHYKKK